VIADNEETEMPKLVQLALAAVVTGAILSLRRRQSRRRVHERPKAKPPAVQTWEGEGGALTSTGAQMGPDPALPVS